MNVNPSRATAVEFPVADECDDVSVRDSSCLVHSFVGGEEPRAAASVADEKLAEDELMANNLVSQQESVKVSSRWFAISKEANPNRGVHEDH